MKSCLTTVFLSVALLLGNTVKTRALVTGPVPNSDGDSPGSEACQTCCQRTPSVIGILQGTKGDAGEPGQNGEIGPIGRPGKLGPRGQVGPVGVKGQKGEIGPIGPMGERGPVGNPGPKGDDGIGRPGGRGLRGPRGEVGATGPAGVKGQKGEPGETPHASNQRVAFTVMRYRETDTSSSPDTHLSFQETKTLLPGTSFNLQTGTFTCTVSGTHVFMFSVDKNDDGGDLAVYLRKNSDFLWVVAGFSERSNHDDHVSGSAILVLQRGDTVYLTMSGRAAGSSFSGFLLYPA